MEIIHLILGKANPERMNGVNRVVYELASQQAIHHRKVEVWGVTKKLTHNYGTRPFRTRLFAAHKNPFRTDRALQMAIREKKGRAVFHLHGGWIPLYASISRFMKKNGISYVLTAHGAYNTIAMQRSFWQKKLYYHLFEKTLIKSAHRVHVIGESEIRGVKKLWPKTPIALLPYGYIQPQFDSTELHKPSVFTIGFLGRLDAYTKGLDLLLTAFADFQRYHSNSQLWIIGDGKDRHSLEEEVEKMQLEGVVFWGGRFGDEKEELLKQIHVFAHPSRNEGLPASVIEAAAHAIPCIVSKATNVGTYVQRYGAGLTISDDNWQDLSAGLSALYQTWTEEALTAMGKKARTMVDEVFAWSDLIEKYDEIYTT